MVIPTFQRESSIARAVESVLGQTPEAPHLVVVDDGSTDGTGEVLKAFGDRIRVITKVNGGVSLARNAGIELVETPWVAFLDSDDAFHEGALAAASESIAGPADACLFSARVLEGGAVTGQIMTKPTPEEDYSVASLLGPDEAYALPAGVFPVQHVRAINGFDSRINGSEDYLFLLRLAVRGVRLRILREPLFDKEEGEGARLSVDEVKVMGNKLAALAVFRELEPEAVRGLGSLVRAREGRYLARVGRKLPVAELDRGGVPPGSRVPGQMLLRAWRKRPLALDVGIEGLLAIVAPTWFHRRRRRRAGKS